MRNTFKKNLTAAIFAMFIALPLSVQATDANVDYSTSTAAKGSVKEILADIRSDPRGVDGEIIKSAKVLPFGNHDTVVASCWYCGGTGCIWIC